LSFIIHVEHKGDGTIYDYRNYNWVKCDPESGAAIKPTDLNVVYIYDIRLSGELVGDQWGIFRCNPPSKAIRLINGKGSIQCEYELGYDYVASRSAYEAPLYIELGYYYGKHITKTMNIKKI
jgi:hypothetical protein